MGCWHLWLGALLTVLVLLSHLLPTPLVSSAQTVAKSGARGASVSGRVQLLLEGLDILLVSGMDLTSVPSLWACPHGPVGEVASFMKHLELL